MKLSATSKVNFGRSLNNNELKEYKQVLQDGKQLSGQTGKSVFIMPSSCLPQTKEFNSGIGHLASDISIDYLKYMKDYTGVNVIEDLPAGQVSPYRNFYCAYNSSAFALGNHQINPELLVSKDFEHLLTAEDLQEIAKQNNADTKEEIVNFKNVMDNDGAQNKVLKKAFEKFEKLDENSPLKQRYADYIEENKFWLDFPRQNEDSQDFFKFKQFLADEHLKIAKNKINAEGMKLCGDCLIRFSEDEMRAFPDAFAKDSAVGKAEWGIRALDYKNINDETSAAAKLLKEKVQLFAKRYDMIRFDVGWAYVTPKISSPRGVEKIELGGSLLEKIENWVKEVKGKDYDVKNNLLYEFEASYEDFAAFDNNGKLIPPLKNRMKVYSSTWTNTQYEGWGYNQAYLNRGWTPDEYMLGVGNHDVQPLRQIANGVPEKLPHGMVNHKTEAITPLANVLRIPEANLQDSVEFAKAKWAEPMMSKNNMMFYIDTFGWDKRFNMQGENLTVHPEKNFAYKVPTDYKKAYHKGLQEGFAFNPMDALAKVFRAKGLDKLHTNLYEKIQKFNKILQEPKELEEIIQPLPPKTDSPTQKTPEISFSGETKKTTCLLTSPRNIHPHNQPRSKHPA